MSRSHKRPQGQGFDHPVRKQNPRNSRVDQAKRERGAVWMGFWLGLLAYLFLSLQQPLGWQMPVWILLAFLVIPGLIGLLQGWRLGTDSTASARFWVGMKGVFWPMAFY